MRAAILPFLFSTSLFAATIDVQPAAPNSATPVTLIIQEVVTCPPPPQVARTGNTFNVAIDPGGCLISPSFPVTFTLPVGLLAPGDYEVVVKMPSPGGSVRTGYAMFSVRDADAQISISGQTVG